MHILVISSFLPPYGGYFCIEQAKALKMQGHEVRILLAQQLGVTVYPKMYFTASGKRVWEKIEGVDVYRTNFRGLPRVVHHNMMQYCKIIADMYSEYEQQYGKPDVIHAHACKWAGVAAKEISRKIGVPFVITEHFSRAAYERDFGKDWQKNCWAKTLLKETFEAADYVIPVARELVNTTKDFFGDAYKWKEISNLIDVDFFRYHERKPLSNRPFRFCCLAIANGEWFYYKGYDVLLEAFKGINNAELHIAGRATDGNVMRNATSGIPDIHIHGDLSKEQVRELLYECDALVLASRGEVQPLVLLEAMSTGIPVVATEVTPQSERIPDACLICATGDVKALRDKMIEVIDILPSESISQSIRNIASPDTVVSQLEEIYNKVWKN